MSEESEVVECVAPRLWGSVNKCGENPISLVVLGVISAGWLGLLALLGVRLVYNTNAAARDTTVAKKMQFLQGWTYSYVITMVSLVGVFAAVNLIQENEVIAGVLFLVFYFISFAAMSQVDVIGTVWIGGGKSRATNGVSFLVMGQYILTTYLAKVVYKLSGHKEENYTGDTSANPDDLVGGRDVEKGKKTQGVENKISSACCMSEVYNSATPEIYDLKDVFGIQGALFSLPGLLVIFSSWVRGIGADSTEVVEVQDVETVEEVIEEFDMTPLINLAVTVFFVSSISGPVLGDWEVFKKSKLKMVLSVPFRALEVIARVSFYAFFLDYTGFYGTFMFLIEYLLMYFSQVQKVKPSGKARMSSFSHHLYASWQSVFFTNYRRLSVDKLLGANPTPTPWTVEFARFLFRSTVTVVGYIVMGALSVPESYTQVLDEFGGMPVLFFIGIASNMMLIVLNLINFVVLNGRSLSVKEFCMIFNLWMDYGLCQCLCGSRDVHHSFNNHYIQDPVRRGPRL